MTRLRIKQRYFTWGGMNPGKLILAHEVHYIDNDGARVFEMTWEYETPFGWNTLSMTLSRLAARLKPLAKREKASD